LRSDASAMRTQSTARFAAGHIGYMVCRYARGSVLLRPLKDGYYLVLSLSPEAVLAQALRHSAATREELDREL